MDIILVTLVVFLPIISGKPILRLNVCSESEAIFTCSVMESILIWNVDFLVGTSDDINRVLFSSNDGQFQVVFHDKQDHSIVYSFMVMSSSPLLMSTMTTNTPTNLPGARVSCSNGLSHLQNSADINTLVLPESPHPPSVTLTATVSFRSEEPNVESSLLHWDLADNQEASLEGDLGTSYLISLSSESNQSNIATSNTSLWLTLFYDQDYNISMVAKNCFGTSEPAELHVVWDDQCPIPWENVGSNVTFEYSINGTRLIYNHSSGSSPKGEIISVCTSNGSWYPNPAEVDLCTVKNQGDYDNSGVTTVTMGSNGKHNRELHVLPIAVSISIAAVFLFLVVLSLAIAPALFVIHRRKRYLRSEVQTAEQAQNEYTEVERTHYYQDDDLDYSSPQLHLDHDHSQRDNHSTFALVSELHNPLYQNEVNDNNPDESLNLDSLLIQLRTHVTPKWYEFGTAIGVPEELLQQYSSYPADECLIEVLNYLLRYHQNPTWRDIAKLLHDTELHNLAESIMNVYETGHLPIEIDADDSDSDENILLPLPLPSNML